MFLPHLLRMVLANGCSRPLRCILSMDNVAVAHTLKTLHLRATCSIHIWVNPTKGCLSPPSLYWSSIPSETQSLHFWSQTRKHLEHHHKRRKHMKYKANHNRAELASMCLCLKGCLLTQLFSTESYQISHTIVSVRSIGDKWVDENLSFHFVLFLKWRKSWESQPKLF